MAEGVQELLTRSPELQSAAGKLLREAGKADGRKNRVFVKIDATETIRKRLQLTEAQFSEALGFADHSYHQMVASGRCLKTTALAAEALMRRQAATGHSDHYLMVCIIKGAPLVFDVTENIREMKLDGQTFYLIPKNAAKGQH